MGQKWNISLDDPSPELTQKHILEDPCLEMAQKCFPNPNISSGTTNEAVLMNPCEIRYSQATISRFFRKCISRSSSGGTGTYAEALKAAPSGALEDLLDQLKSGVVKVEDIPPIRVVWHKNAWYTLDNRRLWVFRNFGQPIPVTVENPSKEFFQKLDLQGDGETVAFQTSQSVAEYKQTLSLTTLVLKWSLEDIQNDGLFINKIEKIPSQFSCMKKYLTSFVDPLLEETRAELKQCLEALGDAPCIRLRGLEEKECKVKGALRKFELEVENQTDLKASDIVLLATLAPTSMGDLLRFGEHYTLALLHGERRDDVDNLKGAEQEATKSLKAEVYAPIEGPEYKELINSKRAWYLIYLTSLATAMRTWKALHRPLDEAMDWPILAMGTNFPIIKEVLYPEGKKEQFSLEADVERGDSALALTSYKFNRSQMIAIENTVFALINNKRPYVRLIQGPPGTGKTTMLVGMLNVFCNMGKRVLMSAPTNTAICEVLTKFLTYLKFESTSVRLGDILLLGNKEKIPVEALSHVFLPDRAKRLLNVLHPVFGYRHKIMTMLELLENAEGMHEQFVACNPTDNSVSFLQFVRDKLECLGEQLVEAVEIACSDLPSKFLKSTSILSARNILSAISHLMMENVSDSVARSWFKLIPKVGGHFVMNGSTSPEFSELYKLVRLLQENLNFVSFPTCTALTVSWLEEQLVNQASVVFCTVSSSGRRIVQESLPFCVAVIDEASQLVEAETAIVMGLIGVKQLVLVGDHHQLPATIISNVARDCGYGRSLFQRLQMLEHPITVLNTQYRMHPSICTFPNTQFYNGELQNGPNVEKNNIFQSLMYGPYKFIDTINGVEMEDEGHSKQNVIEVEILVYVLRKLEEECTAEKIDILEVGIISPYSGQVKAIESRLQAFKFSVLQLEVKSVDGFQGREKDVILVSTVRSNGSGNIGFLEDYRRLNVAITRARSCLYIVGHASTLSARECIWKELIDDAKQRDCFMNFGRNEEVCKLVKRIKIELNQLADLLNPSSILFDDTTWKVLFSKEFIASFTGIKSVHVKQNILHAVLKLAKGQWPKHKFHGLASEVFPDVINVRLSMGLYIVWTVDVQRDPVNQIIKVWNVVSAQKLLWTVKRLENLLLTYSESYLKRCKPNYSLDTKLAIPLKWKKDDMFVWYKSLAPRKESSLPSNPTLETTDGEQTAVLESLLLMKFYCLSSDRAWSGTGKTTVITQKLLQKEQRYWSLRSFLYKDNEFAMSSKIAHPTLRQVIITVSSKLCAAIKQHITRFQRSLLGTGKDGVFSDDLEDGDVMLDEEGEDNLLSTIPNSFVDIPDESFPLVITYHKFLSMLDGSVSSPFLTLKAEKRNVCHVNSARQIEEGDSDTFDSEDESFVNEVRDIDGEESTLENAQEVLNPECIKCTRGREVNYDVFVSFYWVHFC